MTNKTPIANLCFPAHAGSHTPVRENQQNYALAVRQTMPLALALLASCQDVLLVLSAAVCPIAGHMSRSYLVSLDDVGADLDRSGACHVVQSGCGNSQLCQVRPSENHELYSKSVAPTLGNAPSDIELEKSSSSLI